MRRLILRLSVVWLPPYVHPSGACLTLGTSILLPASSHRRGFHHTGAAFLPLHVGQPSEVGVESGSISTLRCDRDLCGNDPHTSGQLTGNGHRDDVGVLASGHEASGAFPEPDRGFPTDGLDDCGWFCQPQLQGSPACGRLAVGPGAFDQGASGMGMPCFGNGPLPTLLAGSICRGDQAQNLQQFSGGIETGESANVGHHGDGHGAWHATQGLQGFAYRVQAPRLPLILEGLFEALEAFGVLGNRSDVCVKAELLSRWGAAHFREPAQGGRVPSGPAYGPDILPEQQGFESQLGGLGIAEGVSRARGRSRMASSATLGT
jgi:hypothetical protein